MSAARKLTLGREIEAARKAQQQAVEAAKPTLSAEDEAKALIMLRAISHLPTRLATARSLGIV
jgi:hypothetical protein